MKTLIELYDERPMENFLAAEVFKPEKTVYLCPQEIIADEKKREDFEKFLKKRGTETKIVFREASLYNTDKIKKALLKLCENETDCAVDITGGTDAALFAAGLACGENNIPVFTYSRKKNSFFSINNADFADNVPCDVSYSVEDYFLMTGGSMRSGRVDNDILETYFPYVEPFFRIYLKYRRDWVDIVTYIVRVSQNAKDTKPTLSAKGGYEVKGEHSAKIRCPEKALKDLEKLGFIGNLKISVSDGVSFTFKDQQIRKWLRDVGSVLEIYTFKMFYDTGLVDDIYTSVIVDWDGTNTTDSVSNEIDVMCTKGITPFFISCKTCEIKTEAINELAILRDRFGGEIAKAAIVSTEKCTGRARHRASELGIIVMDIDDLSGSAFPKQVRELLEG